MAGTPGQGWSVKITLLLSLGLGTMLILADLYIALMPQEPAAATATIARKMDSSTCLLPHGAVS